MDKGKGRISRADDEGSVKVKHKKSGGNNGGNKHFKSVLVKPKTQYQPKAKQSTAGTALPAGTNKASISGYNKESPRNKEGKLVLVDDDGKPLEKVDYLDYSNSDDEVEPVENGTTSFLESKRVGYGPKNLWKQWRDTTVDDEYDSYDDDMYEGQKILENIQTICDNFDIKVHDRKKLYIIFDVFESFVI
nr:hypothetical protein [Tanacetum cinerariifolium]